MFSISPKALHSFREVHTFALFLFTLAACLLLAGSRTLIVFDSLAVNVSCLSLLLAIWHGIALGDQTIFTTKKDVPCMLKEVPAVARITTLRNHSHLFAINVIHDISRYT